MHESIIRGFRKHKVYSSFKDKIWDVELAVMQLISKYNKEIRFLLCVIDIHSKYAWVVPFKNKKDIEISNALQKKIIQIRS